MFLNPLCMPFLGGVPCLCLEEAEKRTATFLVNSAPNETLFEVSVGKMWFSRAWETRVFPYSVWLLMYAMGYLV